MRLLHARHSHGSESSPREESAPDRREIQEALAGNLCRCTGYIQILQAIERAAAGEVGKPISV